MAFEVQPVTVRKGRRWTPVAGVATIAAVILGVAILTTGPSHSSFGPRPASSTPPGAIADAANPVAPAKPVLAPRTPPVLQACGSLPRFQCRLAVRAALDILPADAPIVWEADAAAGIICGDTIDCPPTRLDAMADPLASVTLRFVDGGPSAWVNVVYNHHARPLDLQPVIDAWIVRWIN